MASDMGPAAFLWPPDRAWGAAQDNTPPCGSTAGVENRTNFPLANGAVAIVLQDESYKINLAVSYSNNPTSNDNFSTLVPASDFPELEPGHECYSVPNPPSDINAGSSATLQLSYISESDTDANQTFYACADIIYVELSSFTTSVPCFNVSVDDPTITSSAVAGGSATATSTSALGSTSSSSSHSSHNNDLSGGAIAGTVIGSVAGAALVVGGIFVLWRRYAHKVKRNKAVELRMNELTNPTKSTASSDAA